MACQVYGYNVFILPLEIFMPEYTSTNPHVATWLNHISALAMGIGPRGPTRPEERQGALNAQ